jgi:hypothetical protein
MVSCRNMFGEFKILTVTSLYILEILCFIIIRFILLSILKFIVITQYTNIICYVQLCNARCKKRVINMGTKIYNNLLLEIKSVVNFKFFRKKLKSYLLHSAFYSLQEFFN